MTNEPLAPCHVQTMVQILQQQSVKEQLFQYATDRIKLTLAQQRMSFKMEIKNTEGSSAQM
jgi:hypothetical protein